MQSTESEIWKPVVGYEGYYEVSDHGRVRSLTRIVTTSDGRTWEQPGRILRPGVSGERSPRQVVSLHREGHGRSHLVHRIVLQSFVGPCPDGMEGCHNDGDPQNNWLSNLRWDTSSENNLDTVRHGNHYQSNKTHCPLGHPLEFPNLRDLPNGWRGCQACKLGRSLARKRGIPFVRDLADAAFSRIMARGH